MPGISKLNPLSGAKAAANGSRGSGSAVDPQLINGVNQLPTKAPPKADAATSKKVFQGLMTALNDYEKSLVPKQFDVANEYSIEFYPPDLANAKITKPGSTNKAKTPMQQNQSASSQVDPATQSMMKDARTWSVQAGTPIVQLIDLVMRNSSYITDQANATIDETTQKLKPKVPTGEVAWYKISVQTTPIKFDEKRRDYAYRIKYLVTPYGLSNMVSEFFPEGNFRGLHKSYEYWFTGHNTQIINFEQTFNKLWIQTITNPDLNLTTAQSVNQREIWSRVSQASNQQTNQGAEGKTNEISASAADYLYSVGDQGNIRLRIVGDPAWLQQGEIINGANPRSFTFNPFNSDGTINFDASQVCFDVNWNRPTDYNFNTGIMDVNANKYSSATKSNEAQENSTYRATVVKSSFYKGRFEQELEGILFLVPPPKSTTTTADNTKVAQKATGTNVRTPLEAKGYNLMSDYATNRLKLPQSVVTSAIGPVNPRSAINPEITNAALGFSNPAPLKTGNAQPPVTFAQDVAQRQKGVVADPQLGNREY